MYKPIDEEVHTVQHLLLTFGMLAVGSMPLIFLIIENRLYNPQYILRKTYQSAFIYKIDIMLYGNSAAHEPAIQ